MLASSPIPKQTVGRTFFIAIITLGVVALIQLGAVGWAFIVRFHSTPQETRIALRGMPATGDSKQAKFVDPFAQDAGQAASVPKPTPINAETLAAPVSPAQGRQNELVEQARTLRDRGDMSTALTRLREAQALSPDDPGILSELAITYEKMDVKDKATEIWQRIFNMGRPAGTYYAMAEAKLNPVDARPDDEGAAKTENDGFQPGSVLALVDINKTDSMDAPQDKKFKLKIPLKARAGAQIDVHDVVIQVFFYEQLDDDSIVLTNSNVVSTWITTPVDWSQNDIQILQVEYSAASLTSKEKHPEIRKYFGYIVRVYYKGSLQDMRADPVTLLKQYPPPLTLSSEDAK